MTPEEIKRMEAAFKEPQPIERFTTNDAFRESVLEAYKMGLHKKQDPINILPVSEQGYDGSKTFLIQSSDVYADVDVSRYFKRKRYSRREWRRVKEMRKMITTVDRFDSLLASFIPPSIEPQNSLQDTPDQPDNPA